MAKVTDAEAMRLLRLAAEDWKARATAEAAAGTRWRLMTAALLARVPGRMAEFNIAELGALRAEGLSVDSFDAPDGTVVVRLYKPEAEAPPPANDGPPPSGLVDGEGTPCGTKMP